GGNMQIPNSAGGTGGTFGWNQFGMYDMDPAHYYFENNGSNDPFIFLGNNIVNASASPKGNFLVGATTATLGSIYQLGSFTINNVAAPSCCAFFNQSTVQGGLFSTGFSGANFFGGSNGGSNTGFAMYPAANLGNNVRYSGPLDFQTDLVGPYGTYFPPNLDDYRMRSLTAANGTYSTLALNYTPATGKTATGTLASQVAFAGMTSVAAGTPTIGFVQPTGGTGSSTYSYEAVSRSGCGTSAASTATTITNGVATLSGSSY